MGDKINRESYYVPEAATFNYNNTTGGADSASGGSGGSGMECLQLRSPPGPFHYLISEQAKSLVALQELQNEVGALLEFRDLVIETFPNLRSKMAPSTPASGTRRDWEPGVRVRRKLAGGGGESTRTKPQPSVQDSGFSTETSCGKDAHSSSASASASAPRPRPLEDELWALLDVIQRKGGKLRDEAELLRGELGDRHSGDTAEESFARALSTGCGECTCVEMRELRNERDALLAQKAKLEAEAAICPQSLPMAELGRLDRALETPPRPPLVSSPDSNKFAAILLESNPVELQRQLLISTVQNQLTCERLKHVSTQRTLLTDRLERARELNEDLKFRLEEKSAELESVRAKLRLASGASPERSRSHSSMREMEPLHLPEAGAETPRRRPSRIPLHTAHKGTAPRPPARRSPAPPRPPSAASASSGRARASLRRDGSALPVHRSPPADNKSGGEAEWSSLASEYVARAARLEPLFSRLRAPHDLALELTRSVLYAHADAHTDAHADVWHGSPQRYFDAINSRRDS